MCASSMCTRRNAREWDSFGVVWNTAANEQYGNVREAVRCEPGAGLASHVWKGTCTPCDGMCLSEVLRQPSYEESLQVIVMLSYALPQ
jgi:hypothetical protein